MLEIVTFLMQIETELVLKSRRVVPSRLLEARFEFKHPNWHEAAEDLVKHWRAIAAKFKARESYWYNFEVRIALFRTTQTALVTDP